VGAAESVVGVGGALAVELVGRPNRVARVGVDEEVGGPRVIVGVESVDGDPREVRRRPDGVLAARYDIGMRSSASGRPGPSKYSTQKTA
jgi:hypothetical protein